MKKIGIVGGLAWISTVHYYSALCELGERLRGRTPEFTIESLDLRHAVASFGSADDERSWAAFDTYHRDALVRLETAGTELAFFAANTPHHRFESITRGISIPVVSIVDAVAAECRKLGIRRLCLLGTRPTMTSVPIRGRFAEHGVEAFSPVPERHGDVIELIERLQRGEGAGAAEAIGALAEGDAVALACTELILAFPAMLRTATFEARGVTYLNTLAIHVEAIFSMT